MFLYIATFQFKFEWIEICTWLHAQNVLGTENYILSWFASIVVKLTAMELNCHSCVCSFNYNYCILHKNPDFTGFMLY